MVRDAIGLSDRIGHSFRNASERRRNSKSAANASNCSLGNLSMTRHGGGFPGLSVDVKAMLSSFA